MSDAGTICVVDDDIAVRDALRILLRMSGYRVEVFDSAHRFLKSGGCASCVCLIADIRMPDMDGLELQQVLAKRGAGIPVIIMTGHGDIPLAVRAMKAGAIDFLEKPFEEAALLSSIKAALASRAAKGGRSAGADSVRKRMAELTPRERRARSAHRGSPEQDDRAQSRHLAAHRRGLSRSRDGEDGRPHDRRARAHHAVGARLTGLRPSRSSSTRVISGAGPCGRIRNPKVLANESMASFSRRTSANTVATPRARA